LCDFYFGADLEPYFIERIPDVPLKKIELSSVPLKKLFSLICPRLSFPFPCVPLLSRKHILKVIFIKDVSQNKILKNNNSQKRIIDNFSKFYRVI
jgi:hypothetical protein